MPEATANPLAVVLVELAREFSAVRFLHGAERDFTAWLMREVCQARDWNAWDLTRAWHQELDRRAHDRAVVRGEGRAA